MSYDVIRLREEIERGAEQYGFCPNRIWQVGSQLKGWEHNLRGLLEAFGGTFSHVLPAAMGHEDHSSCTFDYCEFSSRNFTAVQQYHEPGPSDSHDQEEIRKRHEDNSVCFPFRGRFRKDVLLKSVNSGLPTAWAFDGEASLKRPRPYMAVSHVWSDGTGAGPWGSGLVNECIYEYFKKIASRFDCEGIWWDTICIPQDKVARGKALSTMHLNYQYARITLVHDRFLRSIPFVDPHMASVAIILSSWFTRGWTALELVKSRKVKVLFKDSIKDLDEDILNKAGNNIAAGMIRGLRNENISEVEDLLRTLGPRYTSWLKDRAVIAGLLTGIDTLQSSTGDTFQRDIYQNILRKIKKISHGHLFHTSATMSAGFSWFPTNLFQLPLSGRDPELTMNDHGEVIGTWRVVSSRCIDLRGCIWKVSHPLIEAKLQYALEKEKRQHVLLAVPDETPRSVITEAILAKVFRASSGGAESTFKCQFVGTLRLREPLQHDNQRKNMVVNIGDTQGWDVLDDDEDAWDLISQPHLTEDERVEISQNSASEIFRGGNWTGSHHAAWVGDLALIDEDPALWDKPDKMGQHPIHLAAERGHVAIVLALLERGVSPNRVNGKGQTPLHRAAWGGSLQTTQLLLEKGSDIAVRDGYRNFAVHTAASLGYLDVLQRLCREVGVSLKGRNGLTPLHYAAMGGHKAMVEWLISEGADVNAVDDLFGWTPLHCAADHGDQDVIKILLKHRTAIDVTDSRVNWTPLHFAAMNGHEEVIALLIRHNGDWSKKDANGWTPRHFADIRTGKMMEDGAVSGLGWSELHFKAFEGRYQMTRLLLDTKYGTKAPLQTFKGGHIHDAAVTGCHKAVDILIRHGAMMDELGAYNLKIIPLVDALGSESRYDVLSGSFTPLHLAAAQGHSKTVWTLIERGADVEKQADGDYRALRYRAIHLAAIRGFHETVSVLIQRGANVNVKTFNGYTPLHFAAKGGRRTVIDVLLDAKANVNEPSLPGWTALTYAVQGGFEDIVDKLLETHPPIRESNGGGALWEAVKGGHVGILRKILNHGADCYSKMSGYTPLHVAAQYGCPSTAEILLAMGANVNAKLPDEIDIIEHPHGRRFQGFTPLHLAVSEQHEEVIDMLLTANASVHLTSLEQETPLHLAARNGDEKTIEKLLEKGSSPNAKDRYGRTALHMASGAGYTMSVEVWLGTTADAKREASDPKFIRAVDQLLSHGAELDARSHNKDTALHCAVRAGRMGVVKKLVEARALTNVKNKDGHTARDLALEAGNEAIADYLHQHRTRFLERLRR